MTDLLLYRSAEFEVADDGRTLEGIAVKYDHPSYVHDPGSKRYLEEFDPKAALRSIKMRAYRPVFVEHEHLRGSVAEVGFEHSDAEGALMFRARMTDGQFAKTTLARVNDGELRGASLGYRSLRHLMRSDPRGPVTRRTEVAIEEMSLARVGQHEGAGVLSVRSESGTPRLDALRRRKLLLPAY